MLHAFEHKSETLAVKIVMSAFTPKADIELRSPNVCFGPISDSCTAAKKLLFDYLVGAGEQRGWNREAKRLCRFEIDNQLVLGWRLHGKIGGLLAFEDAIDVSCGAPVLVDKINAIGDQNATGNINSVGSDRRKFMLGRENTDGVRDE
jgi:hypothetical protein